MTFKVSLWHYVVLLLIPQTSVGAAVRPTAGIQKFSRGENGDKTVIVSQILLGFVLGKDCGKIKSFIRI
jgi:hypothetical protein